MSRFQSSAKEFRLTDEDLHFVETPGFEKCDASKAVVKYDIQ